MKKLILVVVWSMLLAAMACAALATPRTAGTNSRHTICATVVTASTTSIDASLAFKAPTACTDLFVFTTAKATEVAQNDRDVGQPATKSAITTLTSSLLATTQRNCWATKDPNRHQLLVGTEQYGPKAVIMAQECALLRSNRIIILAGGTVAHKLLLAG